MSAHLHSPAIVQALEAFANEHAQKPFNEGEPLFVLLPQKWQPLDLTPGQRKRECRTFTVHAMFVAEFFDHPRSMTLPPWRQPDRVLLWRFEDLRIQQAADYQPTRKRKP